jgi:uncharacterized protein (TIGR02231 family)
MKESVMYRASASIVAAVFCLLTVPAWAAEYEVKTRIDAVTVFPSGAEVTRFGSINVGDGQHTIIMRDLPANTIAESVRVEATATGQLVIGSVDTRRVFVTSDEAAQADVQRKQLEDERDRLKDQRDEMDARIQAAETQRTLITNLATLPQQPAAASGERPATDWREVLSVIASGSSEAQRAKSEALVQLRDLNRRITDIQKELAQLAPKQVQRTEVKIFVDASAALEGDLTVRYQVPNASWTPYYDARLSTGSNAVAPKLDFVRRASISQRSGESWEQVAITLSTTRPTAGAAAPTLKPMTVDYRPKPRPAPVAAESRGGGLMDMMSQSDESEQTRRRQFRGVQKQAMAPTSMAAKPAKARVVAAPFQALYQVPGRLDVPDTGDPKRVVIGQETAEPKLAVRTVPKVDAKAYLYAKFAVPEGSPVLPGRVSLFRDGTFVGSGQLPVLAPKEDHELGFGSDDLVRVDYNVVQDKRGETGLISTSRTENRSYQLSIKNLHDRPVDVTVLDQIPMSKDEDITVTLTGDAAPSRKDVDDKKGVLAWDFKLNAGQERKYKFGYRVSWPSDRSIIYRP